MITVTEAAKPELARFFEVYEVSPIRIWLDASCKGITLNMELDEEIPGEDQVFDVGGYRFLVENELIPIVMPLTVDVVDGEFQVISEPLVAQNHKGCSCGCSCS